MRTYLGTAAGSLAIARLSVESPIRLLVEADEGSPVENVELGVSG
jgi:hypothetical protein